jgi:hypothetical protein
MTYRAASVKRRPNVLRLAGGVREIPYEMKYVY